MGENGVPHIKIGRFCARKGKIMSQTKFKSAAELRAVISERTSSDKMNAHKRLSMLFDEGTFVEVGAYLHRKKTELDRDSDEDFEPVVTGYGAVGGTLVYAFSQDFSRLSGALGEMHAKKIVKIYDMALRSSAPVVGVFDSAGAKILEGVDALAGYGYIMAKTAEAKNICPQIAVIAGPCGGSNAVIARMFDMIIAADGGSLYTAPSSVLENKEMIEAKGLYERGIASLLAKDDADAMACVRRLIPYFGSKTDSADDPSRAVSVADIIASGAYNVRDVIAQTVDGGSFVELGGGHAAHMVTGFAAINSNVVGIVANDPSKKDGKLCPCAIDKAADFVSLCSGFGIPIITLVDTVGIAANEKTEQKDISKKLARLAAAYADDMSVGGPKITVVLGKAFGTAYTVMGSKAVGADVALALDSAQIAAMEPVRAVEFLGDVGDESKKAEIAAEWAEKFASPLEAAKSGHIDDIIDPSELRARIAASLEMLTF